MIHLVCMIYNSGKSINKVFDSYKNYVDTINVFIDNKNTDDIDFIHEYNYFYFTFKNFSFSRNECVDTLNLNENDWVIFIDDSYTLVADKNPFKCLKTLNCDRVGIKIKQGTKEYYSIRIFKPNMRFVGSIHETIDGPVDYFIDNCFINDVVEVKHLQRTYERVEYDLEMLKDDESARGCFYRAGCYFKLWTMEKCGLDQVISEYKKRIFMNGCNEEKFLALIILGKLTKEIKYFITASIVFRGRAGESYYYAYEITGNRKYLDLAFLHIGVRDSILPRDTSIKDKIINALYL